MLTRYEPGCGVAEAARGSGRSITAAYKALTRIRKLLLDCVTHQLESGRRRMSLTDREMLELNELCDAVVEGALTNAQRTRLETWLAANDDARRYYVRAMDLSASLGRYASEMQMGPADGVHEWTPGRVRVPRSEAWPTGAGSPWPRPSSWASARG